MVLERYSPRLVPQLDHILSLAEEEEVKVRRVNQLLKPLRMELVRGSWRNKPFYRVRVPYEALRKRPPIPLARTWSFMFGNQLIRIDFFIFFDDL